MTGILMCEYVFLTCIASRLSISIPLTRLSLATATTLSDAKMFPFPICTTSTAYTATRLSLEPIGALWLRSSLAALLRFRASSTILLLQVTAKLASHPVVSICKSLHTSSCSFKYLPLHARNLALPKTPATR